MKKLFVLLLALSLSSAAVAQWSTSTVAGMNLSTLSDQPDGQNTVHKTGLYVGLGTAYKFSPALGIKAELLYSRQGISVVDKDPDYDGGISPAQIRNKARLNYLTLPVMLRVAVPSFDKVGIEVGGQAGYLLGVWKYTKISYDESSDMVKTVMKTRQKLDGSDFNRFDYGLTGGVFVKAARHAVFSVRYYYGLQKIAKEGSDEQNRVLSIGLTQSF